MTRLSLYNRYDTWKASVRLSLCDHDTYIHTTTNSHFTQQAEARAILLITSWVLLNVVIEFRRFDDEKLKASSNEHNDK